MKPVVSDPSIERQASAWLARRDAGWDERAAAEFRRWCEDDPRHGAAAAALEASWRALDGPRDRGETELLRAELRLRRQRRSRRHLLGGAAGAALAASIALLFWLRPSGPADPTAGSVPTARVLTPETRLLTDGTRVELEATSQIEVDFGGAWRRVRLLHGTAHFSVAKDPSRSFVVSAGEIDVRAVGTAFAVGIAAVEVEVIVTEGRVSVGAPVAAAGTGQVGPPVIAALDAGHRAVIGQAPSGALLPQVSPIASAELAARFAWRQPRLEFTDTTISEAAALFNRTHGDHLRTADAAVAARKITGVFRADNLDGFVALLESSFGLRVERRADGVIMLHDAR